MSNREGEERGIEQFFFQVTLWPMGNENLVKWGFSKWCNKRCCVKQRIDSSDLNSIHHLSSDF